MEEHFCEFCMVEIPEGRFCDLCRMIIAGSDERYSNFLRHYDVNMQLVIKAIIITGHYLARKIEEAPDD